MAFPTNDLSRRTDSAGSTTALNNQAPAMTASRIFVRGVVEQGDQRGRTLGFPTANIAISDGTSSPRDGVYAGYVHRGSGDVHQAAISIGRRPTFYAEKGLQLLESHLLDFTGDLYGETLFVELSANLRGQMRFASAAQLKTQLTIDVSRCREVLSLVTSTLPLASM